jgi:hypothetical protein
MNDMKLPISDLPNLAVSLPEEVKMYHYSGDYQGELECIERWLSRPVPACVRKRLEIQKIFAKAVQHLPVGQMKMRYQWLCL